MTTTLVSGVQAHVRVVGDRDGPAAADLHPGETLDQTVEELTLGDDERLRLAGRPRALEDLAVVAARRDELEHAGLAGLQRRPVADHEVLGDGLGDELARQRELLGRRLVGRIGRRHDGRARRRRTTARRRPG